MPDTAELMPAHVMENAFATSKKSICRSTPPTTRADQPQPPRMAPLVQLFEPLTGRVYMDLGRGRPAVTKQSLAREPLARGTAS
jgi:hypothetical protein